VAVLVLNNAYQLNDLKEARKMNKKLHIGVSTVAGLLLAAALWTMPSAARNANAARHAANAQAPATQTQSVTGKIASIEKSSFTLNVASDRMSSQSQRSQRESASKTMTFQVDKNTTIDGKLQVGATADVTYREESGNNIAISVRVSS
jgi:hypothetical protein